MKNINIWSGYEMNEGPYDKDGWTRRPKSWMKKMID